MSAKVRYNKTTKGQSVSNVRTKTRSAILKEVRKWERIL